MHSQPRITICYIEYRCLLSICQGGSTGAEGALARLLGGLLRSPLALRAVFIVLRCAHFFNCFQWLNCQFTVNLEGDTKASSCRNHASPHLLKIEQFH